MNGLFGMGGQGVGTAWEDSADGTAQMFARDADLHMAPAGAEDEPASNP